MKRFLAVYLLLLSAQLSNAGLISPTKANGDFIAGTGIPGGNDFTVDTAGSGESVAIRARSRDTGAPLSVSGSTYQVLAGYAANGTSPWWSFDFQFSPGLNGNAASTYTLKLDVDFDPAKGATNFTSINLVIGDPDANPLNSWDDGDSFLMNPGGGAWSNATPFVVANSWNLDFGFWNLLGASPNYDPGVAGEYQIRLSVAQDARVLASTEITVNANPVPEPASVSLLAAGAIGIGGYVIRRRRKGAR